MITVINYITYILDCAILLALCIAPYQNVFVSIIFPFIAFVGMFFAARNIENSNKKA